MSLAESISLALASLRSNKMRALLTLLGIIIGISSVIGILTIGKSLQDQTSQGLESLGANDLNAQVEARRDDAAEEDQYYFAGGGETEGHAISEEMLSDIRTRFADSITGVSASFTSPFGNVLGDSAQVSQNLAGVNTDYLRMNGINIGHGRAINENDLLAQRPVAVISPTVLTKLFDDNPEQALGSEISFELEGQETQLAVVGIYEDAATQGLVGGYQSPTIYVPYSIIGNITEKTPGFDSLSFRISTEADQNAIKQRLQSYFDAAYRSDETHHVQVSDMSRQIAEINQIMSAISMGVSAIGGISLLVGGIGVMNIMLVSVTERTREIGVRKALGARRRDIRLQFVVEAMIICLIGGVIGVLTGGALGLLVSKFMGYAVLPPLSGVLIALVFSMAIGLFFGYYPANKAAKLNPIEALRYE